MSTHEKFILLALEQAKKALDASEVPIGCVIVNEDDQVIASGRNRTNETKNATQHAELVALTPLLATPNLHSSENDLRHFFHSKRIYVTVEPCIMCTAALRRIGLTKVYFGCYNDRFGGCGSIMAAHQQYIDKLVDPYLEINIMREFRKECVELLRRFYVKENELAPNPRKKTKRVLKPVLD